MLTVLTERGIGMEGQYLMDSVRLRLIIAGIGELEEHGVKDFSLRRAALSAQVSCAAPYRHFKDKDEYIAHIIKYVSANWQLLCREIERSFLGDTRRLAIEACITNIRFWLANPNFRSVLMLKPKKNGAIEAALWELNSFVADSAAAYARERGESEESARFSALSLIFGTVMLMSADGITENEKLLLHARAELEGRIFPL